MDWESLGKSSGIIASVAGSAVYAFHRPQKRLGMTILNFVIGTAVSAVLSPAANELLRIQSKSFQSVVAFGIGFLAMMLLPALIDRIEKRKEAIADAVIDRTGSIIGLRAEDAAGTADSKKEDK